mmetsp:Transcript_106821/g.307214  ORF Transcript_106821/g.307214 Transcript_106821/m.307214 type:complete len:84 (+) Transcript_106821:106-357(+)
MEPFIMLPIFFFFFFFRDSTCGTVASGIVAPLGSLYEMHIEGILTIIHGRIQTHLRSGIIGGHDDDRRNIDHCCCIYYHQKYR